MIRSWLSQLLGRLLLRMSKNLTIRFCGARLPWMHQTFNLIGVVLAISANYCMSAEIEYIEVLGGPQVIHIQVDTAKNIVLQAYWPSRWHFDSELNPMVPVTASQVLLTGTAKGMDTNELGQRLENLRVQRSITNTPEAVIGSIVTPTENFEEATQLLNMVLVNPAFDPEQLDRTKRNLQSRIQSLRSGIDSTAWELARSLIMQDSPAKRYFSTSIQNELFSKSVSISDIETFYDQTITRKDATVVLSTPFESDQVAKLVDELFDGLSVGYSISAPERDIVFPIGKTVVLYDSDVERSYLVLAGIVPPVSRGREFEDLMALILFGQGGNSILYEALRPELDENYEFATSMLSLTSDLRILQIAGMVDTDKLSFSIQTIRQTYEDFRTDGPQTSLDGLKLRLIGNLRANMENPTVLVPMVMESVINGFTASNLLESVDVVEAITPNGVRERLQSAFPPEEQLLTVVVTSDPNLIPNACVIENLQDYRECL